MKLLIFLSLFFCFPFSAQEVNKQDKELLEKARTNSVKYLGGSLCHFLKDIPEIGMIRIAPNNIEKGIHVIIIGFTDNTTYKKAVKKDSVLFYVKGSNQYIKEDELIKEDISTKKAIKKYGNLKIVAIIYK